MSTSVELLKELKAMCLSSYGAGGRYKIIHLNPKSFSVHVTSISSRIFGNMSIKKPLIRLLVQLLERQRTYIGDSGLFSLSLAANLIARGWESGLPIPLVVQSYRLAEQWTLTFLDNTTIEVSWSDMKTMLSLVRSSLATKGVMRLTSQSVEYLSVLIVKAFLRGIQTNEEAGTISVPNVRILCPVGQDPMASEVIEGVIVDIPLPPGAPRVLGKVKTVLYNVNLDLAPTEQYAENVVVTAVASSEDPEEWARVKVSERAMTDLCDEWVRLGVGMVASQKRIHPFLKHLLLSRGLVPFERLSIRHIQALHAAIGGQLLGTISLEALKAPTALGCLQGLRTRVVGKKTFVEIKCDAPIATLVAWSVDQQASAELQAQLEGLLKLLKHTLTHHGVLPGGGCFEALLAQHLHTRARSLRAPPKSTSPDEDAVLVEMARGCVLDFAACFEDTSAALGRDSGSGAPSSGSGSSGGGSGLPGRDLRESTRLLIEANARGRGKRGSPQTWWGWRYPAQGVQEVLRVVPGAGGRAGKVEAGRGTVVDSAWAKRRAVEQAIEAACMLLRIDRVYAQSEKSITPS